MNLLYLNDPGIFKKHNKFFFNNTKKEEKEILHKIIETEWKERFNTK